LRIRINILVYICNIFRC